MKIDKEQIAETFVAGKTKDGKNIVYVATHGGLHAFFCKDEDGSISSIGAAPHKAIARFLAEKKEPGIKWGEEFSKSEDLQKMGLKGDWKKEGHVITHHIDEDGTVIVKATHPKYGQSASAVLEPRQQHDGSVLYYPGWVGTERWAQRKGLATGLLDYAKSKGFNLDSTIDLSLEGKEFAEKYKSLNKSEEEIFQQLRKFMFAEAPLQKNEPSDVYVVYDVNKKEICFMKKEEIIEGLKSKTLSKYALARDLACSIPATCIAHIPDFEGVK